MEVKRLPRIKIWAAILNPPNLLCLLIDAAQSDLELLRGSQYHLRLSCRLMPLTSCSSHPGSLQCASDGMAFPLFQNCSCRCLKNPRVTATCPTGNCPLTWLSSLNGSWFSMEIKGDYGISLEQNQSLQARETGLGQDGSYSFLRISFPGFNTYKFEPRRFQSEKLHNHIPKGVLLGSRHFYMFLTFVQVFTLHVTCTAWHL